MSHVFYSTSFGWLLFFLVPTAGLAATLDGHTHGDVRTHVLHPLLPTKFIVVHPTPEPWEVLPNDIYENRGIAQMTRVAKDYLLTISCNGLHQVFIHQHPEVALEPYVGKFVQAQYTYAEVTKHVQCIKAPCHPVTERKIVIHSLKETNGSEATWAQFEKHC